MTGHQQMNSEPEPEPALETRTIQDLVDEGYVGFIRGSDGCAIVDPIHPERLEDWDKLRWRFDF